MRENLIQAAVDDMLHGVYQVTFEDNEYTLTQEEVVEVHRKLTIKLEEVYER